MFSSRRLLGLAVAAGIWGLVQPAPVEAASQSQRLRAVLTARQVNGGNRFFGLNEQGDLASLGRDAFGRTARQFDRFLLRYVRRNGLRPPGLSGRFSDDFAARQQQFILNRFALAAAFNANVIAGGVFFGPEGSTVTPVSPLNIFTFFPAFRFFPDFTGFAP